MRGKVKVGVAIAAPLLALLVIGTLCWLNRPFQHELATYRTSLAERTEAQRHNIQQAALALDGMVVEPGETFSFNKAVGPRTPDRGYREAPAFMERDLVSSFGGGICQVSSTLYNATALSGLVIIERHSHSRRVASVPPGRDATVWYGMTDLKFKNGFPNPIRLTVKVANEALLVTVEAPSATDKEIVMWTEPANAFLGRYSFETVRIFSAGGYPDVKETLSLDVYSN